MSPEQPVNENGSFELPLFTRRRVAQTLLVVLLLLIGIYFLFPKLVGLGDALSKLGEAEAIWIVVAIGFELAAIATYIALFKAVVGGDVLRLTLGGDLRHQPRRRGRHAPLLGRRGAAGSPSPTGRCARAGMVRHEVARRMVAFLTLQYVFYPLALIVFGVLLRTGVLPGKASVELTIVPGCGLGPDLDLRRARRPDSRRSRANASPRTSTGPAAGRSPTKRPKCMATVGEGVRFGFRLLIHPGRGGLAVIGAVGYWAANIGILWASFKAFGVHVPLAVVVQGFFLGMVGNLFPLAPGGVGAVDAGMIGAFVLFGIPEGTVFPAILIYRLVAFWLPIPLGVVAFFQLRNRVTNGNRRGCRSSAARSPEAAPGPAAGEKVG